MVVEIAAPECLCVRSYLSDRQDDYELMSFEASSLVCMQCYYTIDRHSSLTVYSFHFPDQFGAALDLFVFPIQTEARFQNPTRSQPTILKKIKTTDVESKKHEVSISMIERGLEPPS